MSKPELPRVLCVDDEPRVLEGLLLHLRKDYSVHGVTSGEEALRRLKEIGGASVVISDMRMPGMDGATLLRHVMASYPDTTRILLTGDAGRDAAVAAVNEAQIFRYLTKPCAPDQLRAAVEAGVGQHALMLAEKKVLKETLIGCIQALTDVLAIANPVAFGRASRLKRLAMGLAASLDCRGYWQLEAAAMLSQLGYLSLPAEIVEKIYFGERLTPEEQLLANSIPDVVTSLLEHIPRLEPVMQILTALTWTDEQVARLGDGTIGLGARILGLALEYDQLLAQGQPAAVAVQSLRTRSGRYGATLIEQFAQYLGTGPAQGEARQVPLRNVRVGMVMMQDVRTHLGTLLIPRGLEVTSALVDRIRHFGPELSAEQVNVLVLPTQATAPPPAT